MSKKNRGRVFIKSFGCSSNLADGEFMAGCLDSAGFELVDNAQKADVSVYNTCAVKTPTENRIIEVLKKAQKIRDTRIVVTGCLPLINPQRLKHEVHVDAVLGPSCGRNIVEVVQRVLHKEPPSSLFNPVSETVPTLLLPRLALNPLVSIVPVAQGCLGSCAYCCVVRARGRLRSNALEDIVERIETDLKMGAREVWLTSQDVASYGRDIKVNLAHLLREACALEGDFMVRVGMMTPNLTLDMLSDIIDAFQNEHVFKFVHLPVQSGDNHVLKRMNRPYSVEGFKAAIEAFRNAIPRVTVATDVICGFPGESHEAFDRSLGLIEEIRPDVVNISKFFPRPNTAAEKMMQRVSPAEVVKRSREAASLAARISLEKNRRWLNWEGPVLIDEVGKRPNTYIARNFAYKPVVINNSDPSLLGTFQKVKVTEAFQTYLKAEILD
jgi:MiaB-like tRNA modifying enzyme